MGFLELENIRLTIFVVTTTGLMIHLILNLFFPSNPVAALLGLVVIGIPCAVNTAGAIIVKDDIYLGQVALLLILEILWGFRLFFALKGENEPEKPKRGLPASYYFEE